MRREITPLTGLRGIAAVWVMLYHFFDHTAFSPKAPLAVIGRGYLGVDIFFLLSGYILARSYGHIFRSSVTWSDYRDFLFKRIARVYPVYIFFVLLMIAKYKVNFSGARLDFHTSDFAADIVMIQAWGFGFSSLVGHTWSLSTEMFAYLLFPALAYLAVYARPVLAWCVFAIALSFLMFTIASGLGVNGSLDVVDSASIAPLLRCLAGFSIGLLAYRVSCRTVIQGVFSSSTALAAVLAACVIALYAGTYDLVVFALFTFFVPMLAYQSRVARILFANPAIYHLGLISYSLYIVHPLFAIVGTRLEPVATRLLGSVGRDAAFVCAVALTWLFAWVLYRFIEEPGRKLFRRVLLGRRTPEIA